MRKCPNCKKNIPVGARRCVHCRAVLSETDGAEAATSTQLGVFGNREPEQARKNSTAFGRPGSLNPLENNSMRGSTQAFDDAPHQTMLGLATVSPNANRSRAMEDNDRLAAGNHTIAGMPGIKLDNSSRRQSFNQDSIMGASSARMNRATPVSSEPVPKSVAMNAAKPATKAPELKIDDNPFGDLPGAQPVPSSLVDEEFVDLTAKLFGDEFAAGGSDLGDEDGWDFDIPEAPAAAAPAAATPSFNENATGVFNSPDILENLLKASSIQAQKAVNESKTTDKAETTVSEVKSIEKAETKPAEPAKPAEEVKPAEPAKPAEEVKPAEPAKPAEPEAAPAPAASTATLTLPAQLLSILAAILSIAWIFGTEGKGISSFAAVLGFTAVALLIDIFAVTLASKLSSKAVGGILAVLGLVFFALIATTADLPGLMKTLLIAGGAGQIVCAVIFLIRKD